MTIEMKAPTASAPTTSETIDVLMNRVSVRSYTDRPVEDATVDAILKAAFRAPTSSNIQAYSVVIVRDQSVKDRLAPITGNQKHVVAAPLFLAFCADLTRLDNAFRRHGHSVDNNNLEFGLVSSIDAALVGMSAYVAADSLGLKGVMIGAIRNNAVKTAEVLGLPRHVYCVFGMCLGWPDKVPPQKPRMEYGGMVHYDQYGNQGDSSDTNTVIDRYDRALAAHYESRGMPTAPDSWTHEVEKKLGHKVRPNLRAELKQLGFDFL